MKRNNLAFIFIFIFTFINPCFAGQKSYYCKPYSAKYLERDKEQSNVLSPVDIILKKQNKSLVVKEKGKEYLYKHIKSSRNDKSLNYYVNALYWPTTIILFENDKLDIYRVVKNVTLLDSVTVSYYKCSNI